MAKQGMSLQGNVSVVIAIVMAVGFGFIMLGMFGDVASDIAAGQEADSAGQNLTELGITNLNTGADKLGTVQTISIGAGILMIIGAVYYTFFR